MKTFGTTFPFVETDEESQKLGRHVANFEFLRALLKYSKFDEFHLFCLNVGHFDLTAEKLKGMGLPAPTLEKIRLFLYQHLIEQLKAHEYHVFHLGGWGYFLAGLAQLRAHYAKRFFPITGCIHSLNSQQTPYHAFKALYAPLSSCDAIVCSSEAGRQVLLKTFGAIEHSEFFSAQPPSFAPSTAIIPLGVGDETFAMLPKQEARQQLGLNPASVVILSVGRFSPSTKMDYYPLLQIFKQLTRDMGDGSVMLVLAGSGSEPAIRLLQRMVDELGLGQHTRLLANFEGRKKSLLYGAADIFVSLSDNLQETFGISPVEAMAAGLPVVISDINGYKELIDDGVEGFRVPTTWTDAFDMAELADIMNFDTMQLLFAQCMAVDTEVALSFLRKLARDPGHRTAMGARAKERAQVCYRWEHIIGQYETLWDGLNRKAADTAPPGIPARANPFLHDYLHAFSHYPTRCILDTHRLAITPAGKEALASRTVPIPYADVAAMLNTAGVLSVLGVLQEADMELGVLRRRIEHAFATPNLLTFTVLWMAKYCLIRIS